MLDVKIKLLNKDCLPEKKHSRDACYDCRANIDVDTVNIPPHSRALIPLGFCLELPEGYEAVLRPRSGLSGKGIDVCIGTIDENYRGEVGARVCNDSDDFFKVEKLDRICQMAIRPILETNFIEVEELSESERNSDGFGSTGVK